MTEAKYPERLPVAALPKKETRDEDADREELFARSCLARGEKPTGALAVYRRLVRSGLASTVFKLLPRTRARMNRHHDDAFDKSLRRIFGRGRAAHALHARRAGRARSLGREILARCRRRPEVDRARALRSCALRGRERARRFGRSASRDRSRASARFFARDTPGEISAFDSRSAGK